MKEKISKSDLLNYFDLEAESARKEYETLMKLPLEDRIHRRKAVDQLYWDYRYVHTSEEGHLLYRLKVDRNFSDFKEGDYLILHKGEPAYGQSCQLYEYDEDDHIIIDVYPRYCIMDDTWKGVPLTLDKSRIDLRSSVYNHYTELLDDRTEYWDRELVNMLPSPHFLHQEEAEKELEGTSHKFGFSFTVRQREAILRSMTTDSYYLIQGPPGTGKSFVLGVIILEELFHYNHKVAVIGPNHMAINNAMLQVLKLMPAHCRRFLKIGQYYNARNLYIEREGKKYNITNHSSLNVEGCNEMEDALLYGLTPHSLYTRRARNLEYDTLIIDEAGQVTIPLALMAMQSARKVILAGDHKQLPPILSSERLKNHMKESIFQRLLKNDNCTLLDISFRMCGPICRFVGELFYEGMLKTGRTDAESGIWCENPLYSYDSPVVLCNVEDDGEQTSEKEADIISRIIIQYCQEMNLQPQDIGVIAPFRAQVSLIRRKLRKMGDMDTEGYKRVSIDTVDKMQGQEREVIIYSMTAGKMEYMNEMGEFLFNPNKLNVAFSRARSKLILVANVHHLELLDATIYPHIMRMLTSDSVKIIENR